MPSIGLPEEILGWKRSAQTQKITRESIFDYMDGAGELYIGYRFDQLDVYEYQSEKEGQILVELYWMESADEPFGLLSLDWGGEVVDNAVGFQAPGQGWPAALYGAGLLRMRVGRLYARLLAEQDSDLSKQVVLGLGRVIAKEVARGTEPRTANAPPRLLACLPDRLGAYSTASSGKAYFRSHLVLNSIYFLSTQNILELGRDREAVSAEYRSAPAPGANATKVRVVVVNYPSEEAAKKGKATFSDAYLKDPKSRDDRPFACCPGDCCPGEERELVEIEDGWVGIGRAGRTLFLIFDCPDALTALQFLGSKGIPVSIKESAR